MYLLKVCRTPPYLPLLNNYETIYYVSSPCFERFDFSSGASAIEMKREQKTALEAENSGTAHGVFMWWELEMDTEGKILLSCAPHWAHPQPHDMPVSVI